MATLELQRLACLSTAHLAEDVAEQLDWVVEYPPPPATRGDPTVWEAQIVLAPWGEVGWFVWVRSGGRDLMPPSLRACLEFAERAGVGWVQFDRDVPPFEELPTYDW